MELKGKTILITGGTAGIGLEAVKQFLQAGCRVIVTGRNQAKLDEAKRQYPAITAIRSDAGNFEDANSLLAQVEELGGIDILYNNAGIFGKPDNLGIANDIHYEKAKEEITINYSGVIHMNNVFMAMLQSRKESAIINVSSFLSHVPLSLSPTYSASKAAVRFYTVALREHLKVIKSHVKVFELQPPIVATEMTKGIENRKISAEDLVKGLIAGLRNDTYTIQLGLTKAIYYLNRFFPSLTFRLLNPAKNNGPLLGL